VRWLGVLLALLVAAPALAAQVQLVVPYRSLEVGQQGQADVVVINGKTTGVPALTADAGLDVRYLSQSRGTRVVNTTRTTTMAFTFSVRALNEGSFTLGPVTVVVDGTPLTTEAVVIQVTAPPPDTTESIVAYANVHPESAWEGQVALYTYGLRTKVRLVRAGWMSLPVTRLARPREGAPVRREYVLDDPAGAIAIDETTEPFVVTSGADLDLEPAVAQVEVPVDDPRGKMRLFQPTEARVIQSEALHLDVRPLPPPPPGFTGLVGDFVFNAVVDGTKAAVGESVEWTITARGDGSLEGFVMPPAPDRPDVRFYDGSPIVQAEIRDATYHAFGQYQRIIVPTEAGQLSLPPLEIVTFSPSQGRYVTARLEVPTLDVTPGREGGGEMESFAPDAGPVHADRPEVVDIYPVIASGRATSFVIAPWFLFGALVTVLISLATLALDSRDAWRARHPIAEVAAPKVRDGDPLALLDESLREALSKRLHVPTDHAREAARDLPEGLSARVAEALRALERVRFAGEAPGDDLADRVRALVLDLEKAA